MSAWIIPLQCVLHIFATVFEVAHIGVQICQIDIICFIAGFHGFLVVLLGFLVVYRITIVPV